MSKLTDKQERFCREYLIDLNATQAAIRAGYSKKTAQEIGSQNLSKLIISERIQRLKDIRADRLDISSDNVLKEVSRLAFSKVTDILKEDETDLQFGTITFKSLADIPEAAKSAISEISKNKDGTIKVKMHSKGPELEKLMRHLGLYEVDNSQKNPSDFEYSNLSDKEFEQLVSLRRKAGIHTTDKTREQRENA